MSDGAEGAANGRRGIGRREGDDGGQVIKGKRRLRLGTPFPRDIRRLRVYSHNRPKARPDHVFALHWAT